MNKTIIALTVLFLLCLGYVAAHAQAAGDYGRTPAPVVGRSNLVFDPVAFETSVLPNRSDLPLPASLQTQESARKYTGIIKNKTRYEVSVPSENSDATLIIPPNSWIEYTMWTRRANVTAYHNGKPFYCLKLCADPSEYPFMCKNYDFMAEIVKPEAVGRPSGRYKPMKKRQRHVKKQPNC